MKTVHIYHPTVLLPQWQFDNYKSTTASGSTGSSWDSPTSTQAALAAHFRVFAGSLAAMDFLKELFPLQKRRRILQSRLGKLGCRF